MKIIIKYENKTYTLNFTSVPSMSQLKKEISNKTQVDPKYQKIILKGNVISQLPSNTKVSKVDIKEGTRLLILSTFQNENTVIHHPRTTRKQLKAPVFDIKDQPLNSEIVSLGPPHGCEKGVKNIISNFPKNPFIIYDTKGNISQMAIEQDSFWINQIVNEGNKGEQDRIFYSDINEFKIVDIDNYENQYCAIILKVKKVDFKKFYFIPYQYSKVFKDFLKDRIKENFEPI